MNAADRLRQGADMYNEKGVIYGHTHILYGKVMEVLFPGGLPSPMENEGPTSEYYVRLGLFQMITHKYIRLAVSILGCEPNVESVRDLKVYAAMLESAIEDDPL